MKWIVDGHNLIPHVPGMSLSDLDDEQMLIAWLSEYIRCSRDSIELYFDRAAPGQNGRLNRGRLTILFVPASRTADQAISDRLHQMGKQAADFTVVSSDHQVQANARECRAKVMNSAQFSQKVQQALGRQPGPGENQPHLMSEDELNRWLETFASGPDTGSNHQVRKV